jgi:TDG/mug DNA glycosylase family protein
MENIFRDEITAGAEVLMQKIKMYRPKIVAFNGRGLNKRNLSIDNKKFIISGIYEVYAGNKHFHYGKQPDLFLGTDTVCISNMLLRKKKSFYINSSMYS